MQDLFAWGALTYKSDKSIGAITDNFLSKKGSWVTDPKKGLLDVKLHKRQAILTFFFAILLQIPNFPKFDDFAGKFWSKKQK